MPTTFDAQLFTTDYYCFCEDFKQIFNIFFFTIISFQYYYVLSFILCNLHLYCGFTHLQHFNFNTFYTIYVLPAIFWRLHYQQINFWCAFWCYFCHGLLLSWTIHYIHDICYLMKELRPRFPSSPRHRILASSTFFSTIQIFHKTATTQHILLHFRGKTSVQVMLYVATQTILWSSCRKLANNYWLHCSNIIIPFHCTYNFSYF